MWEKGTIRIGNTIFTYSMKRYDEPSVFGIEGGRISKLELRKDRHTVAAYDRGWDTMPADDEAQCALDMILWSYN